MLFPNLEMPWLQHTKDLALAQTKANFPGMKRQYSYRVKYDAFCGHPIAKPIRVLSGDTNSVKIHQVQK